MVTPAAAPARWTPARPRSRRPSATPTRTARPARTAAPGAGCRSGPRTVRAAGPRPGSRWHVRSSRTYPRDERFASRPRMVVATIRALRCPPGGRGRGRPHQFPGTDHSRRRLTFQHPVDLLPPRLRPYDRGRPLRETRGGGPGGAGEYWRRSPSQLTSPTAEKKLPRCDRRRATPAAGWSKSTPTVGSFLGRGASDHELVAWPRTSRPQEPVFHGFRARGCGDPR